MGVGGGGRAAGGGGSRFGVIGLMGSGAIGGLLVLAALVMLSLARRLSSIATKDVLGKTIAKRRRGTLMGWSGSVAGGATLVAGGVLMWFGDRPGNLALAILLGVAAAGWLLNALCAARIKEVPGSIEGGENAWDSIKLGLSLLREDRTFLHFNVARACYFQARWRCLTWRYSASSRAEPSWAARHFSGGIRPSRYGGKPDMGKTRGSVQPPGHARRCRGYGVVLPIRRGLSLVAG